MAGGERENARINDADETLLAVSALGTVEKYWIRMGNVDSECDDLDQTDINTTNPELEQENLTVSVFRGNGRKPEKNPSSLLFAIGTHGAPKSACTAE